MKENAYIAIQRQFDDYLERKHLKRTEERHKVLEVICAFNDHFDVNMILDQLQKSPFTVSRATVYNTLELLIDADVVIRHPLNGTMQQYALCCLSTKHPQAKRQGAALRSLYHAKESFHAGLLLPLHLRPMRKMQA